MALDGAMCPSGTVSWLRADTSSRHCCRKESSSASVEAISAQQKQSQVRGVERPGYGTFGRVSGAKRYSTAYSLHCKALQGPVRRKAESWENRHPMVVAHVM